MQIQEDIINYKEWISELCNKEIVLDIGGGSPFQGCIKKEMLAEYTRYYCLDFCKEFKPNLFGDIQL